MAFFLIFFLRNRNIIDKSPPFGYNKNRKRYTFGWEQVRPMDESQRQNYLQKLRRLRLLDDDFMSKCFEDVGCVQLVLRILMEKPDLLVQRVETQLPIKNLQGRSVRLDVYAVDTAGTLYNIEIQRDDRGAGSRRARLNSSLMDADVLDAGEEADRLPETYVIFITEHDVLRKGRLLYHIERTVTETGEPFGDGAHILYVNTEVREDTPVGRLMADFLCTEPDRMFYRTLAERTRYFKEDVKGVATMCQIWEEVKQEGLQQGMQLGMQQGMQQGRDQEKENTAVRMLESSRFSLEEIAEIAGLPLADVKKLAEKKNYRV